MDDAALLHPTEPGHSLVFTLDVITPIFDDPVGFGRIAAANSLSDVYAMGARPQVALTFAGMPASLGLDTLHHVLQGVAEKAKEAGCAIVGGHTIKDTEPKCGLVVLGAVAKDKAWTHTGAKAGQSIVLTKAIGTGVLAQAMKAGEPHEAGIAAAAKSMETLNAEACRLGLAHGATAATDVTGFGLLGHLQHIAGGSQLRVHLHTQDVPLLPGALDCARAGFVPGGSKKNGDYVAQHIEKRDAIDPALYTLLIDAQTSGGLLLCLDHDAAEQVVQAMDDAAIIGSFDDGPAGQVLLHP